MITQHNRIILYFYLLLYICIVKVMSHLISC